MPQDLAHFFFDGAAVLGRSHAQSAFQVVVESTDEQGRHDGNGITDIKDINESMTVSV